MTEYKICEICGKRATDKHHKYEQYKRRRKRYGNLIDRSENIQWLCNGCHIGKKNGIEFLKEKEFCKLVGVEVRSKTGND